MWNRVEVKQRGKVAFKRNYGPSLLAAFVLLFSTGTFLENGRQIFLRVEPYLSYDVSVMLSKVFLLGNIVVAVYAIFLGHVLEVGCCLFFTRNQSEQAEPGHILAAFHSENYMNIVKIQFLKNLKIVLWTFVFIVPGIIKMYEYAMVPYILAENPGMESKDVFKISKNMMMGRKLDFFVMGLSFLGWQILSLLTLGILGIFYVNPYIQATIAEIYVSNKANALQEGYIQ